jgi:serine protease Do
MVKVMSAFAALSIAAAGVTATAGTAAAAAPAAGVAQAEDEKGVIIVALQKGGPAATAGLRRGDIVLKVNETEVNDAQALRDALAKLKPGDEVQLLVARGDGELTIAVKLGDADGRAILGVTPFQAAMAIEAQPAQPAQPGQQPRGQQMDPQQAEELRKQLEERFAAMSRTRVAEVTKDSPADKAGLKQGDLIIAVNETELSAD